MKSKKNQKSWSLSLFAILLILIGAGFLLLWQNGEEELEEQEGSRPELADTDRVTIDGEVFTLSDPIYVIDGVVMIPLRELFEKAGAEVIFHPYREQAVVTLDNKLASVRIGQRYALIEKSPFRMRRASMVIEGAMYVPLGLAEETL